MRGLYFTVELGLGLGYILLLSVMVDGCVKKLVVCVLLLHPH